MEPIKITAHLRNGFAAADEWSPSLDGILAYWKLYLADPEQFNITQGRSDLMEPVDGLPLEKITDGELWWWACSFPMYEVHHVQRNYFHRRFDDQHERFMPEGTRKVMTAAGPLKNYRKTVVFRLAPKIEWHCVGDGDAIMSLLSHCHHVGAKPSQGYGAVIQWEMSEGDERIALFHRPLPVEYAKRCGISGPVMEWGIRPPARIPANIALCVMPSCEK